MFEIYFEFGIRSTLTLIGPNVDYVTLNLALGKPCTLIRPIVDYINFNLTFCQPYILF